MMGLLSRKKLLHSIDASRVRDAIAEAETRTSGEMRVTVSPFFWGNVEKTAHRAFVRMGMMATKQRNAVLFFLVPFRKRFAVIGDQGIHEKVGTEFWQGLVAAMSDHFQKGKFTDGLIAGIQEAGKRLAEHFPYDPQTDVNELPDDIDFKG